MTEERAREERKDRVQAARCFVANMDHAVSCEINRPRTHFGRRADDLCDCGHTLVYQFINDHYQGNI